MAAPQYPLVEDLFHHHCPYPLAELQDVEELVHHHQELKEHHLQEQEECHHQELEELSVVHLPLTPAI